MKRAIRGTTGKTTSTSYIKARLFDYMTEDCLVPVDTDTEGHDIVERIKSIAPYYDIDDALDLVYDEGITLTEAVDQLIAEVDQM